MNGAGQCGAVLISKRFVLTAAHCVGTDNDFEIGIQEKLPFYEAAFLTNSDSGGIEYRYSNGIVHPDYNDYSVSNDIALYELAEDVVVPLDSSIPYIRLERTPVTTKGTAMTVIGFGDTDPDNAYDVLSDELLEATVGFVPRAECIARMGLGQIGPDMLCAYNPSGEDSCGGDSGGPLLLKGGYNGNNNNNINYPADDSLVGLVSWGYDCGGNTPGVYTNIAYFYDWIVKSMCAMNPSAVPEYVVCSSIGNSGGSSSNNGNGNGNGNSGGSSTVAGGSESGESNEGSFGSGNDSFGSGGGGSILTPPETQDPPSFDDELLQDIADWFQEAVDWVESFWA